MRNLLKIFGISVASFGILGFMCTADAVTTRDGTVNRTTATARMPSMPTISLNTIGNLTPTLPPSGQHNNITGGNPGNPGNPDNPDNPGNPDDPDDPDTPTPECEDGGVKDSTYTVNDCMNDLKHCVNTTGLPNGLNDMFNEDLRNAIVNGMGLCVVQVEKCIAEVRRDCKNVYITPADVWIDFNARVVQPEYYTFILRQTGLTPNQAENTCWLLDKNAYGSSFTAVSAANSVTSEYMEKVGAYNRQGNNSLTKQNPQGVDVVGNPLVDSNRGHYARWDATKGQCLIRVAAYNKDKHITNSWLGIGDDTPAEVWVNAGDTFTCNKDFFGFSLMNQTKSAALIGITTGTALGAGIGALAGHGDRAFSCADEDHREKLAEQLRESRDVGILNEFLESGNQISVTATTVSNDQCEDVVALYNVYNQLRSAIAVCNGAPVYEKTTNQRTVTADGEHVNVSDNTTVEEMQEGCSFREINIAKRDGTGIYCDKTEQCKGPEDLEGEMNKLKRVLDKLTILAGEESNMGAAIGIGAATGAGAGGLATMITAFVEKGNISCRVGDGLEQVGFNKAHSISTLKDFYVKWNLHLPDVIQPTGQVVDCATWRATCADFPVANQCEQVQINYKPVGATTQTLVRSACTMSGSVCIENYSVARSHGACP